jgi:uncharacterized membrane protein YukC
MEGTEKREVNLTETEAAYIAGFLDGEASFLITIEHKKDCIKPVFRHEIVVANTNREIMEWLQNKIGGKLRRNKPKRKTHKIAYTLVWRGYICKALLPLIIPYLRVKKKHAEIMLESLRFLNVHFNQYMPEYEKVKRKKLEYYSEIKALNSKGVR